MLFDVMLPFYFVALNPPPPFPARCAQALQKEAAYFRDHPAYKGLDKRVGTTNLSKSLNQVTTRTLNPFGAPEPPSILNPSNFVPINGFPVVKGLSSALVWVHRRL